MYEVIQNLLTLSIEVAAIAGVTGIIAHAFWKQHTQWMATYCPPVAPYTPDTLAKQPEPEVTGTPVIEESQPVVEDVWEGVVERQKVVGLGPVSRHFSPQLALPAAKDEPKPTAKKSRKTPSIPKAPKAPAKPRKRKAA